MEFYVQKEVFFLLPELCFGVVVAKGVQNTSRSLEVEALLAEGIDRIKESFKDVPVKEQPKIIPYRQAFLQLGYNPNKFLCSIEALTSRIIKGGELPRINDVVDLANAISLKTVLPIGAHDMEHFKGDIALRFSSEGDAFTPFGSSEAEKVNPGELVYVSGNQIKTRKWIWRQSEEGKITQGSTNIFFPIDGFKNVNEDTVISARDQLAKILKDLFQCEVKTGYIDGNNPAMEL